MFTVSIDYARAKTVCILVLCCLKLACPLSAAPAVSARGPDPGEGNAGELENGLVQGGLWQTIKGRRARDSILLGMWSIHMTGGGEFFGGDYNEQNHLLGIQYAGFGFGTFINSHDDRAYFAGVAREVHSVSYGAHTRFDTRYNAGIVYGYGDNLPNVLGISPQLWLTFGFSWRRFGIDLGWSPVVVATLNFRVDLE